MNFKTPTVYEWARLEEGYEQSALFNSNADCETREEDIDQLMSEIDLAIDTIRNVCYTLGNCKKCIYLDEDGCALKVKEWNA